MFPGGLPPSIVTASSLYDRVRDGNEWCPAALSPESFCRMHKHSMSFQAHTLRAA